jgi:hypothetical protein
MSLSAPAIPPPETHQQPTPPAPNPRGADSIPRSPVWHRRRGGPAVGHGAAAPVRVSASHPAQRFSLARTSLTRVGKCQCACPRRSRKLARLGSTPARGGDGVSRPALPASVQASPGWRASRQQAADAAARGDDFGFADLGGWDLKLRSPPASRRLRSPSRSQLPRPPAPHRRTPIAPHPNRAHRTPRGTIRRGRRSRAGAPFGVGGEKGKGGGSW